MQRTPESFFTATPTFKTSSDIGYGQIPSNEALEFSELTPDVDLTQPLQIDQVNEWVQEAPLPSIEPLLLIESSQLPDWAKNHEWLVLRYPYRG